MTPRARTKASPLPTAPQTAPQVREVAEALRAAYGDFAHHNRRNPLDELLFIMCSVQTDELKYRAAHRRLRKRFPRFAMLAEASVSEVASAINGGGLANQRAEAIVSLMSSIVARFGRPSLSGLRQMDDAECEAVLMSLPRVGKKTARCVMLYALDRAVFPVDVHTWRVATRLGWIQPSRSYNDCSKVYRAHLEDRLQEMIPAELRFSLHVNFVSLGREHCRAQNPSCHACPINRYCRKSNVGPRPASHGAGAVARSPQRPTHAGAMRA
jgi:endonuclease III